MLTKAKLLLEDSKKSELHSTLEEYISTLREIRFEEAKSVIDLFIEANMIPSGKLKNLLLFGIARQHDISQFKKWIDFMGQQSYMVEGLTDSIRYNAMIVASRKQVSNTLALYDQLKESEITVHTYTCLLRNFIEFPDIFKEILLKYKNSELPPHPALYVVQIQYYFLQGQVLEALELLDEAISLKIKMTTFMANVVLQGLFENGKVDEAIRFFNDFNNLKVHPDSFTFGILIHQLSTNGMVHAALGFYEQCKSFRIPMTLKLWTIILNTYTINGDIEKVESTFLDVKKSTKPNTHVFCILMRANADAKNFERVLELYQEMKDHGLPDTELARRYVIVACAHIPHLRHGVMEIYKVTFSDAFKRYKETLLPPSELMGLYLRLFGAYSDDSKICFQLYLDMWKLGLDNTVGMNYLVVAHYVNKNYRYAYKWGTRLLSNRISFSNSAYRAYLMLAIKKQGFEKVTDFLRVCKQRGQIPPLRLQNHLLEMNIDNPYRFKALLELFGELDWNTERFRLLITFYGNQREIHKAWQLWQDYLEYVQYHDIKRLNVAVLRAVWNACVTKLQYANNLDRIIAQYGFDKAKIAQL